MKNDITLLIGTCDRYDVLWENFMILTDKYFKVDCPKLFVTENKRVPSADYETHLGKKLPWSNRMFSALDTIDTEYVFLLLMLCTVGLVEKGLNLGISLLLVSITPFFLGI